MNENIKVVVFPESEEKAYVMGFDRFENMDNEESEGFELGYFTESATFINNVAPSLRAMSGYSDSKGGTYQINSKVVTVKYPGDRPMDGELTESRYVYDKLFEAFRRGVYDAVEGREKFENLDE